MAMTRGTTATRSRILPAAMIFGALTMAVALAQNSRAASPRGQKHAEPETRSKAEIIQLERRWLHAEQTGDVAALNQILASDMVRPYPAGSEFVGKREMIEYARSHGSRHPVGPLAKFAEIRVSVYGQTAIARGILVTKDAEGKPTRKMLFTDVFLRRQGRWQAVSAQENNVPDR
jgi:ketosteroid isomerase-like protein